MAKKDDNIGACRLCNEVGPLSKSHILPEFMYDDLFDNNHQIAVFSQAYGGHRSQMNSGRWERLLCEKHETFLNIEYETYASGLFRTEIIPRLKNKCERIELSGIDSSRFKLFLLSLLWRMSVSSDRAFSMVSLGSHEETIRKMLLAKEPGEQYEFGVIMASAEFEGSILMDVITEAKSHNVSGTVAYSIFIAGIVYTFVLSSQSEFIPERRLFLPLDGSLSIPCFPAERISFLAETLLDADRILRKRAQ